MRAPKMTRDGPSSTRACFTSNIHIYLAIAVCKIETHTLVTCSCSHSEYTAVSQDTPIGHVQPDAECRHAILVPIYSYPYHNFGIPQGEKQNHKHTVGPCMESRWCDTCLPDRRVILHTQCLQGHATLLKSSTVTAFATTIVVRYPHLYFV